jgi:hypothetical protein
LGGGNIGGWGGDAPLVGHGRKMFFSEEKNQKTLISSLVATRPWPHNGKLLKIKVFCFFSSEKKTFLF